MAATESHTTVLRPKRRWFQFRLWTLFVLIGLLAVVFACLPKWRVRREVWALRHGDEQQRGAAAEALALMGPQAKAAVPALIDALEYEDGYEEQYFQFFFESYAGPTIEPDLAYPPPVDTLAAIGSPAVPDLVAAMQHHEDEDVRRGCAAALGRMQPTSADVVQHLKDALADRHWGVREQAAYSLSKVMKDSAPLVPLVRDLLHDDHEYVRFAAANLLWNVGPSDGQTISDLSDLLTDENEHVREMAARVLKEIAPEVAIDELGQIVADPFYDRDVRWTAVYELGDARLGEGAVVALARALRSDDDQLRSNIIDALGNMGAAAKSAVPLLTDTLSDEDPQVRSSALQALNAIQSNPPKSGGF